MKAKATLRPQLKSHLRNITPPKKEKIDRRGGPITNLPVFATDFILDDHAHYRVELLPVVVHLLGEVVL